MAWSCSSRSNSSFAWRRTFRTATRASSARSLTTRMRSLRRSSVRGGKDRRMTLPSLLGVSPRSEVWMPRSIAEIAPLSKGWITSSRGSGTEIEAMSLSGCCVP